MIGNRLLSFHEFKDKFGDHPRCLLDHYAIVQALRGLCSDNGINNNDAFFSGITP